MTNDLPFDPCDPPATPPNGADALTWRLSYALLTAHEVQGDGFCSCREFAPCPGIRLAVHGLLAACRPQRRPTPQDLFSLPRELNALAHWDLDVRQLL